MWSVKINAGKVYIRSYIGNNVTGDWFLWNVTLANRVSAA